MKTPTGLIASLVMAGSTLAAQDVTVTPLLSKDLGGAPGRELTMIAVEYPPGASIQSTPITPRHLSTSWKAPS